MTNVAANLGAVTGNLAKLSAVEARSTLTTAEATVAAFTILLTTTVSVTAMATAFTSV